MSRFVVKRTRKEDDRLFQEITSAKVKCPTCGHSVLIYKTDRVICDWCNHWVYRNDKARFKFKMKEEMIKNARNNKC